MELRPSQIFYSQDSILNRFGDYTRHANMNIVETLDDLLVGRCNVDDILTMNVMKMNGSGSHLIIVVYGCSEKQRRLDSWKR